MARDHSPTADLVCPKCRMFGCDCVAPSSVTARQDVCTVCRRHKGLCICRSHVQHVPVIEDKEGALIASTDTPTDKIEAAVKELKHYWYDTRDAEAAVRMVRDLATRAYRVTARRTETTA